MIVVIIVINRSVFYAVCRIELFTNLLFFLFHFLFSTREFKTLNSNSIRFHFSRLNNLYMQFLFSFCYQNLHIVCAVVHENKMKTFCKVFNVHYTNHHVSTNIYIKKNKRQRVNVWATGYLPVATVVCFFNFFFFFIWFSYMPPISIKILLSPKA